MKKIKKIKWAYITVSVFMIILGILLIIFPKISALTLCCVIGTLITLFGIVKLIGYFSKDLYQLAFQFDLAFGILALIAGILILIHPVNVIKMIPVILGVIILVDGVFKLQTTYDAKRFGLLYWWWILILAIVTSVCGLFLIVDPFKGAISLMALMGITLTVDGIQNLCIAAYAVKEFPVDEKNVIDVDFKESD